MTNIYTHACSYYFSQSCVYNQLQTRVEYTETTIMFIWTITNGKNKKRFEMEKMKKGLNLCQSKQ